MTVIVGVHGIGQQLKGERILHREWCASLLDGLTRAGMESPQETLLTCAFYGDLFRQPGSKSTSELEPFEASDVEKGLEQELLLAMWEAAAGSHREVQGPAAETKGLKRFGQRVIQDALSELAGIDFFAKVADRAMATMIEPWIITNLKQFRAYLLDADMKQKIRARVEKAVDDDTRVLIGHSLGSIVAYECLCAHSNWPITTFVTLGSPLGIPHVIFDRLDPRPTDGVGAWPGSVKYWYNIADVTDIVALVKQLRAHFDRRIIDESVNNGTTAHDVSPYLAAEETGRAIALGVRLGT